MKQWFSYDPEGFGFDLYETAEEAKAQAHKAFEGERDAAHDSGWSESVSYICWGRIMERAQETERRKGEPEEEFDEYIVYKMVAPDTVEKALRQWEYTT